MSTKPSPRRVLYCESSADGTIGGSHYCLLYLIEHLDRTAFDPMVLFHEEHPLLPRFEAAADTVIEPRGRAVQFGGESAPMALVRRGLNLGKYLGAVAAHVAFLTRNRIDLVHLNNSVTRHQDWMLAARIAGLPCIVHERGLSDLYTSRDRWFARNVNLVIPVSAWIRNHLVSHGLPDDNIRVMHDGLDPGLVEVTTSPEALRREWQIAPDAPVVGIVGNVRPWKGQETVVRAALDVARDWPNLVCCIVGAAPPADQAFLAHLKRLAADAGLESVFRFTGYRHDIPSFMNMMEFVIHASRDPEPFGMVLLEGMAQRKAVIGSRAGGPVEVIVEGETGFTFPPGDAPALAARMRELLADPARAKRMGAAGHARLLEHFSVSAYMGGIHQAYRAVLDGRPLPPGIGLPAPLAARR